MSLRLICRSFYLFTVHTLILFCKCFNANNQNAFLHWNTNKSIFQAHNLATNFHKHRFTSLNWNVFASLYIRRLFFDPQAKYAIFITRKKTFRAQMRKPFAQRVSSKSLLINQVRWHCSGNFYDVPRICPLQLLLFFTPSNLVLPGDRRFRNTEGLFAYITKPRGRSDGFSERKARSFVRRTIRKDKVNIFSEKCIFALFEKYARKYRYFAVTKRIKENNLLFTEYWHRFIKLYRYRVSLFRR